MEKEFYYIELFEIYKGLLTDKQRDMFYSHYCLDLSFREIAETEKSSRQSVYDAIKKVKLKLDEYEKELRLREINQGIIELAEKTDDKELSARLNEIIGR